MDGGFVVSRLDSRFKVQILANDQATPGLARFWISLVLDDDYVGSALAHEGIEPPDDVVSRIANDLRMRVVQAMGDYR